MRPPRITAITKLNHHSTVVPGHAERPEQDLRMTITGGQQLVEEWFAGGWAGGWVGGQRQVSRAHAIPQGGKSRGCGVGPAASCEKKHHRNVVREVQRTSLRVPDGSYGPY